jgi:hypothetical protein
MCPYQAPGTDWFSSARFFSSTARSTFQWLPPGVIVATGVPGRRVYRMCVVSLATFQRSSVIVAASVNPCATLTKIYREYHDGFAFPLHVYEPASIQRFRNAPSLEKAGFPWMC